MAGDSTALAGGFEFFVAGGVDFMLPAGEAVCRGEIADGGMEAPGVVVVDEVAGDALGVIMITPLILVWRRAPTEWFTPKKLIEVTLVFGSTFLFGQIVFLDWFHESVGFVAKGYWVFLFITWIAVRIGVRGVTVALLMIAIVAPARRSTRPGGSVAAR